MNKIKYVPVENKDGYVLYIGQPIYKTRSCSDNCYFRNKHTLENCGQHVALCEYVYNIDGSINENPVQEEDVYEVVLNA